MGWAVAATTAVQAIGGVVGAEVVTTVSGAGVGALEFDAVHAVKATNDATRMVRFMVSPLS